MLALAVVCASLKPIILVPGTYASLLKVSGDDVNNSWYCPDHPKDELFWLNEKYIIPPLYNCVIHWAKSYWNEENQSVIDTPGLTIDTIDFGGLGGVNHVDYMPGLNISIFPYYTQFIKFLKKHGYIERDTLYGAPNDWRLGISGQKLFNQRAKKLIEEIYEKKKEKVVLLGHSFGSFVSHYFVSGMDQDWVDKYIDKVVLLAPSFSGSGQTLEIAWTGSIHKFIDIKTKDLTELLKSAGAVHTHFPNFVLNGDRPVFIDPSGKKYTAAEFPEILRKYGKYDEEHMKILGLQLPYLTQDVPKPKAPTYIAYNSKHSTPYAINVTSLAPKEKHTMLTDDGDGTILSSGIVNFCQKHGLECFDIEEKGIWGGHFMMLNHEKFLELFYSITQK